MRIDRVLMAKARHALRHPSVVTRNIGVTLARQLLAAVLQLGIVVFVARVLGPEGNGQYAMAILLPSLLATVLNLGIGPANVYYLGRRAATVGTVFQASCKLALVLAAVGIFLGGGCIALAAAALFPNIPTVLLWFGLVAFPFVLLNGLLNTILQGREDFRAYNWTFLTQPAATLAFAAIALGVIGLGAVSMVAAFLLGHILAFVITLRLLRKHLRGTPPQPPNDIGGYAKQALSYGWKAHLSNMLTFLNYRADIFIVNLLLGPLAAGLYVIAVQIAERLGMLSQAVSTVLLPRLSALHQYPQEQRVLTLGMLARTVALTLVAALLVGALAPTVVPPIFGTAYGSSIEPLLWLLPGIVAGAGSRVISNYIAALGRPELNLYTSLVVLTVNVLGNIMLIPHMGILGAALATTIAYFWHLLLKIALMIWLGKSSNSLVSSHILGG